MEKGNKVGVISGNSYYLMPSPGARQKILLHQEEKVVKGG
jgi:hypothetical protein